MPFYSADWRGWTDPGIPEMFNPTECLLDKHRGTPTDENRIIDIRYSILPHEIDALWAIELTPENTDQHVYYRTDRAAGNRELGALWSMINGEDVAQDSR